MTKADNGNITLTPCCATFHHDDLAGYNLEQARFGVPCICTSVIRTYQENDPALFEPQ
jgi:hypothetical protein